MIKNTELQLYSPTIAKVVMRGLETVAFIPNGATGLIDSNGAYFDSNSGDMITLYDRAHRGKSWFILDLRTT